MVKYAITNLDMDRWFRLSEGNLLRLLGESSRSGDIGDLDRSRPRSFSCF